MACFLVLRSLLLVDDAEQLGFDRSKLRYHPLVRLVLDDAGACAGGEVQVSDIHQALHVATGPRRLVELTQRGEIIQNASSMPEQAHSIRRAWTGQINLQIQLRYSAQLMEEA